MFSDLNSKMVTEFYFQVNFGQELALKAILRRLLRIKHFCEFWNFIEKRKWWNVLFHTVFVTVRAERTILASDDLWIQYSLCFLTIFLFICCLNLIGCSSLVLNPLRVTRFIYDQIARSILIGRPIKILIRFWNSKRMRRGSPISLVCTIKLPVSH